MNIEKIVTDLISFKTSHNNPKEIKSCLKYCKDLFENEEKENKIFIKEYSKNNIDSLVISNTNDKDLDVILLGHIDTVDGPDELFEAKIKNGFLYGRGSMDMKAFVGTNLVVLKEIIANNKISRFIECSSFDISMMRCAILSLIWLLEEHKSQRVKILQCSSPKILNFFELMSVSA